MNNRTQIFRRMLPFVSGIVVIVVFADQLTKQIVVRSLALHEEVPVIAGLFNLTLVYNKGVAFGMGSGLAEGTRQLLLSLATLAAVLAILYFLFVDYLADRVAQFAIALILGGAVGNVIDRVLIGSVIDFLDFYYGSYHWPAFNVADSAIFSGVVLLVCRKPLHNKTEKLEAGSADTSSSVRTDNQESC